MTTSRCEEEEVKKEDDEEYGCKGCHPSHFQGMNNIKSYVFWLCVFNFWEGFIVNGIINVVLVALERRYSLSSTESGLIASANDFGAFIFLLLVGHFGEKRHKPRIMTFGILLMAIGSFIFTLPHFIGGKYRFTTSNGGPDNSSLCTFDGNISSCDESNENPDSKLYPMFLLAQILLGIGAAPLFTIGLTYIDENTEVQMTSLYTGITTCAAAVGVAAGYAVGGQSLTLFVDIDSGIDGSPLSSGSPQWVGAWWIGSSVASVMFLLVAAPILGFPKQLPGYAELLKTRQSEAHNGGPESMAVKPDFGSTIRDFPKALYLLLRNPTYLFVCFGGTCDALVVGGIATFGAKLLQQLYNVELSTAGWVMGAITVPGSGGGMILGGYLVKRLQLRCRGILKLCALFSAISLLFSPSWLAHCPSINLAGLKSPYNPKGSVINESGLTSDCNVDCNCATGSMEPICTNDGLVYFSPCHAGCSSYNQSGQLYTDCKCFDQLPIRIDDGLTITQEKTITAKGGNCAQHCLWLYVFCGLFFFIMLCTFATISPNITAVFRCVPYSQRSLAIGLELLFVRLLGTTPGPILFGYVIDSTCEIWQDNCGSKGSCWFYESNDMGIRILYWWIALKCVGVLCYLLAFFVYKPPSSKDKAEDTIQSDIVIRDYYKGSISEESQDGQRNTQRKNSAHIESAVKGNSQSMTQTLFSKESITQESGYGKRDFSKLDDFQGDSSQTTHL